MKKMLARFTGVLSHPYSVVLGITMLGMMIETLLGVMLVLLALNGDGCDSVDTSIQSQLECPGMRHS